METGDLLYLFGHSIYHPDVDRALIKFDAICPDKSKLSRYASITSNSTGIKFTFWFKEFYESSIGNVLSTYKFSSEHEVVLSEITFIQKPDYLLTLPYGLNFGDTPNIISSKLNLKPFNKSKNFDNQTTWIYYNDKFEIMPVFDKDLKLLWLRIWALSKADRNKIELKQNLKKQNKNINTQNIDEIIALKHKKPTKSWRQRFDEGDLIFNEKNIVVCGQLLDDFLDQLVAATRSKLASSIYSKTKNVIEKLNKLNQKDNSFIETLEREELVLFIEDAIKFTGFRIENGVDITEDWRTW